jgi:hypothetical protein
MILGGMNMKQINKIIIVVMILIVTIVGFASFAASDYITENYTVSKSEISSNDIFKLTLDLENISGANSANYLQITNSNFEPTNGIRKVTISNIDSIAIDLKYIGSDNEFIFNIFQNDGTQTGSETINIIEARKYSSSSSSSSNTDTTKYMPLFQIKDDYEVKTFIGGKSIELSIPIVNIGKYSGKNVDVTLDLENGPFVRKDSPISTVDRIAKDKVENAIFNFDVSNVAMNKMYKIPVKIEGYNSFGDVVEVVNTEYMVKITNNNIQPKVSVFDYELRGNIADDNGAIILELKNFGSMNAKNVSLTLEGFTKEGIRLYQDTATKRILEISGGKTRKEYFRITNDKNLKSGTYELTAKMEYFDEEGNEYSTVSPVYVNALGINESDIDLSIENLKHNLEISTGNDLDIEFNLKNNGLVNFERVEVTLEFPSQMISKTPKKIIIDDFKINDDKKWDNYDFFIRVKAYLDKSDLENYYTVDKYFGVFVKGASEKGRPKLIVDNYTFNGSNVLAGDEFPLTLFIKNTSDIQSVKNIKVSIESAEGVFMPVNTSSSFFIDEIKSNQILEKMIMLKTTPDASVKSYNMVVKMEYEDADGNAYDSEGNLFTETDNLSIAVLQPIRLETSDITLPMEFYMGQSANLEVEFYNMGRSTMNNMMIKAEGDFDLQNGSYFKGDFQSGSSDYFSTTIIPTKEGITKGKIIFSFEDAIGNISEIEKEFEINAFPKQEFNNNNDEFNNDFMDNEFPQEETEKKNKLPFIIIGIIIVSAGLILFLKNRKKRKLAKLMEFDDLDD